MSLEVSRVIRHVQSADGGDVFSAPEIAIALAFLCGLIVLGIGLLRIGWLIEFIPTPSIAGELNHIFVKPLICSNKSNALSSPISGFMTGSALQICAGQVSSLLGYSNKLK